MDDNYFFAVSVVVCKGLYLYVAKRKIQVPFYEVVVRVVRPPIELNKMDLKNRADEWE